MAQIAAFFLSFRFTRSIRVMTIILCVRNTALCRTAGNKAVDSYKAAFPFYRGVVQLVACQTWRLELSGSNPVPAIRCVTPKLQFNILEPSR